jgi:DNA mismatch repair protein PMS2
MPKKIQAVVALKACRSAIMIGDVLTHRKMREHVDNMKSLREPWFCAHGRPTTVFIMNLDKFKL